MTKKMQNDRLTDFDLELREMFHDAEEEVSSRMWDSLNVELDRKAHRKVVALRWRRAAACVAAAAVLSGIFITLNHAPQDALIQDSGYMAGTTADKAESGIVDDAGGDVIDILDQIASSSNLLMADVPAGIRRTADNTRPSETVPPAERISTFENADITLEDSPEEPEMAAEPEDPASAPSTASSTMKDDEQWTDPFALLGDDEQKDHRGISLSLSGNVMSNDISGGASKGPSRAPSAGLKQKTGITERSVSTYGIPLTFGIGANLPLNDKLSLGTGINWSLLSRSFTGIYTEVDKNGNVVKSINSEINNDLHYIGIPLNLYYNILTNRNLKFYAWGGGSAEKGVYNSFRIHNEPNDVFYTEKVKGLQWSAAAGVGLEFNINDFLGLYFDPSARYYFDCSQPASVRTQKSYMFNFEVGLRFNLQ